MMTTTKIGSTDRNTLIRTLGPISIRTPWRTVASCLITAFLASGTWANEPVATHDEIPSDLPFATGYFGGIPFYTAFHQSWTTRLLLLKGAHEIPEVKEYLRLTPSQLSVIEELRIVEDELLTDHQRATLLDVNSALDEDLIDPNFYEFLNAAQRELLDRFAVEFDGLAGLTRSSIADRIELTEATRDAVVKTLVSHREQAWLPYFRYEFAARLPLDHEYRRCVFVGEYLLGLNQAIARQLTAAERKAFAEWMSHTELPHAVIEAVKQKAPLPDGLFALAVPNRDAGQDVSHGDSHENH